MNRGQKLFGSLSPQEVILLAAGAILFMLVLAWILLFRRSGPEARGGWLDELAGGILGPTATPVPAFGSAPRPVQVIPSEIEINCTYPSEYWRLHSEAWAIETIIVGGNSFSKERIQGFLNDESGEPVSDLYKEFFTTALNTMKGADAEAISSVLRRARIWLGSDLLEGAAGERLREVVIMAEALRGYNAGIIGPGRCSFEEMVLLPTPTVAVLPPVPQAASPTPVIAAASPTASPTLPPSPAAGPSATASPGPSVTPPAPTTPAVSDTQDPSRTPAAAASPTSAPPPTATREAAPSRPVPPTPAPPPTGRPGPTLPPPPADTLTPTSPPTPTPAPTTTSAPSATPEPSPTWTLPPPSPTPAVSSPTPTPTGEPPSPTPTLEAPGSTPDLIPTGAPPPLPDGSGAPDGAG